MLGTSFAMDYKGAAAWVPVYGSPTVSLMRCVEEWRKEDAGWFKNQVLARSACVAAVGAAALEALAHALAAVGTSAGMVLRATVRTVLRTVGGILGGTWGWIYGNAISFDIRVWIRRIIINVVIFSRGIRIAWDHWMERRVMAADHLFLGIRFWAYALRANDVMKQLFCFERVAHHAGQAWSFVAFGGSTLFAGVLSPETAMERCKVLQLGAPMPGPSLIDRVTNIVTRYWWAATGVAAVAAGVWMYSRGKPDADGKLEPYEDIHDFAADMGDKAVDVSRKVVDATFGLIFGFAGDLVTWFRTSIRHMEADMVYKAAQMEHWKVEEALWDAQKAHMVDENKYIKLRSQHLTLSGQQCANPGLEGFL